MSQNSEDTFGTKPDLYKSKKKSQIIRATAALGDDEISIWDSVTDYTKNVNKVFNNTVNNVATQYNDMYTTVSQSIPDSIPFFQSTTRASSNTSYKYSPQQINHSRINPDHNASLQSENKHLQQEAHMPHTGLFKFLPKPSYLVTSNRSKISRTTSIDQVRSSLVSLMPPPKAQQNQISLKLKIGESYRNLFYIPDAGEEKSKPHFSAEASLDEKDRKDNINPAAGNVSFSDAEAASELAEGTILALRDMILEEAVELNESLRFWTERWERPYLSWLEAGPKVWFSEEGYNHFLIGQKVSEIQAVLARRCATIGELQEHLLRAGWRRKGIAHWGVLGQGDQWATVAGRDGPVESKSFEVNIASNSSPPHTKMNKQQSMEILPHAPVIGKHDNFLPQQQPTEHKFAKKQKKRLSSLYYGHSSVFVKNICGGKILVNDPAVASWSVDAIRVIRDQLYRAGNDELRLPFYHNWPEEVDHFDNMNNGRNEEKAHKSSLPVWASESTLQSVPNLDKKMCDESEVRISDLPAMAAEVSELLNSMETQMEIQKCRRLQKLRPPAVLTRSWYVFAAGMPVLGYLAYILFTGRLYVDISRHVILKVSSFYSEHFSEPIRSIFSELISNKERRNITDQNARMNAMESLQKMIKGWLDEVHPKLDEIDRIKMAAEMDISLIEKRKELSLNNALFEIQDIVRMSIIEMQFIKKELMNAMSAIDELMDSNEINFRLGAILPAFMVIYGANGVFRYLRYALLKLGKSKQQIHASIRQILLDIERLLVVRNEPPIAPPPLVGKFESKKSNISETRIQSEYEMEDVELMTNVLDNQERNSLMKRNPMLSSDDLGMLMLLVHELRSIIWKNRWRFSRETILNITEDLSELAGERGAISIKQQLQIISRMYRTYSFLKVVSTGLPLERRMFV